MDPAPGVSSILTTNNTMAQTDDLFSGQSRRQTIESLSLYQLPGFATLFYKSGKLELPSNFRTVWKTRALNT